MKRRRFRRRLILLILLSSLVFIWAVDYWVTAWSRQLIYSRIDAIPHRKVGLLLGAPKFSSRGVPNLYYTYRIEAAAALFRAGKIDYILVSGDSTAAAFNQTGQMRDDLMAMGVPGDRIVLDKAGFRTLDSILRCYAVFGENHFTVISQLFHNERALFIARMKGYDAIAFNARAVTGRDAFRQQVREKLARVKMLLDLVFGKEARMYGPKMQIGELP